MKGSGVNGERRYSGEKFQKFVREATLRDVCQRDI